MAISKKQINKVTNDFICADIAVKDMVKEFLEEQPNREYEFDNYPCVCVGGCGDEVFEASIKRIQLNTDNSISFDGYELNTLENEDNEIELNETDILIGQFIQILISIDEDMEKE